MKVELLHVINGYRKFHLGFYDRWKDEQMESEEWKR